ncbi:GTPase IMAP family member 2-like isoform X2 [Plectropomus leopardus]|uniref:GTPase IMAP family member 2-like isoform X2 n=1 Tax=Plectropomus leopardus TaxID=160734 RepID=UPI001C4C5876|nr:GTPase IMAP family member 2-like isoform X2 [Plectropomus leopardus]
MSHSKKISVVVLGCGSSLKKSLITTILGRDLSKPPPPKNLRKNEIYENDTYVVVCTPKLETACEDIRELYHYRHHDMSLLVVEDGFSSEVVWQQIEMLHSLTQRPTEEFSVVLPLRYKETDSYPFKFYTIEQVFNKLRKLAQDEHPMSTDKRHPDYALPDMSTPHAPMEMTGDRNSTEQFTDPKKSLKRIHASAKVNLVLLGMAGTGKSASGNTILGKKKFTSTASSKSVTTECQEAETRIGSRHVRVIDTPDIFDDNVQSSFKDKTVRKCKELCQQDPCVYVLVMHVSRFTDGERDILKKLEKAFGDGIREQTVILFTRGDDLKRNKISLKDFLEECQPELNKIVERCDRRCVLFENKDSRSDQVGELMKMVATVFNETPDQTNHWLWSLISKSK